MSDMYSPIPVITGSGEQAAHERNVVAARKALARHAVSLDDYAELCSMVLDDHEAAARYRSWQQQQLVTSR